MKIDLSERTIVSLSREKMSDLDDLPDLVDSSDDDSLTEKPKQGIDHAEVWLRKPEKFLVKQELWMRVFCLAPFLYGVPNVIPKAWITALQNARLLLNGERQESTEFLEWPEWECVDLMDHVACDIKKHLRNKETLGKAIDCVIRLDEKCRTGVIIDVDWSIREAEKVQEICSIWRDIQKNELAHGREKASKFAVLYAIKIYSEHVLMYSLKARDFVAQTKQNCVTDSVAADNLKVQGNTYFKNEEFEKSICSYSLAVKKDPFQHIYYGNRSQAYNKLNKFMDALADGRRAVTIQPDYAKGYYRYAYAFHKLGRLDSAIFINKLGQEQCSELKGDQTVQQLKQQGGDYKKEREDYKLISPMPKDLDAKLGSMQGMNPSPDLNIQFDCSVPLVQSRIIDDEDVPGLASTDSDSGESHRIVDQKGKKKKQGHKQTRDQNQKSTDTSKDSRRDSNSKFNGETLMNGTDMPEKHRNVEDEAKRKKQEDRKEFTAHLMEGYDSMMKNVSKKGLASYQKALEMVAADQPEYYGLDELDMVTLKYVSGSAAVATGIHKNIMEGIEKFNDIIENHADIRFPLAYYGLGKAYVTLNRFQEAMEPLKCGVKVAFNVKYAQVTWPGTKQLVEENDASVLLKNLKDLLQLCRCPPQPDAVCVFHSTEAEDSRTSIYINDPDFKGFTKIICQMDCSISFHPVCWRAYKLTHNKQGDKEMFDTVCPTPDCKGVIVKIEITRSDSITKDMISEKYQAMKESQKNKKPSVKQKPSSESKLAKKQQRKELRKQKKRQRQEDEEEEEDPLHADNSKDVIVDGASASAFIEETTDTQPLPDVRDTTVLKKEEIKTPKASGKGKKSKKRKEKNKQVLAVEVNFNDKREGTLLNENSVLSDGEVEITSTMNPNAAPFSVPPALQKQVENFEKTYTPSTKPVFVPDEITENLFSFFEEILKESGPLEIGDTKIQQELEVFPVEALEKIKQVGGLADFLKQSLKFAVIDDCIISLMSDAKKAREVALMKRNSGQQPVVKNAWKTVGKGVQNTDSLGESVTGHAWDNSGQGGQKTSFSSVVSVTFAGAGGLNNSQSINSLHSDSSSDVSSQSVSLHSAGRAGSEDLGARNGLKPLQTRADALDSIDDFPIETKKGSQTKGLDEFKTVSDPGLDFQKPGPPKFEGLKVSTSNISRSSSKSDISEKSSRSDFSLDTMPKPLRPIADPFVSSVHPKTRGLWDSLENDFDSTWSKLSDETNEISVENKYEGVEKELQMATDEFVRKSDETLVNELAESVVDRMFTDKQVSEEIRRETLQKVSLDIWKDFEKSASAGKMRGLWANTPAGEDYSKNMGKFAADFMKKHYDKSETMTSPTSAFNIQYPHKPPIDSLNKSDEDFSFNKSPVSWTSISEKNYVSSSNTTLPPSSTADFISTSNSSGYNMFSGLSWGFDSFSQNPNPVASMPFSTSQPFIRPPPSASSYYNPTPGSQMSFPPPQMLPHPPPRMPMPPQMTMTAQGVASVDRKDKETQCLVPVRSVECMTDPYEPLKDEYQLLLEEKDQLERLFANSRAKCEKLSHEYKIKDQYVMALEDELRNKISQYEQEKNSWQEERSGVTMEIQVLKQQLHMKEASESKLQSILKEQESKVVELAQYATNQRDKDLSELQLYKDKLEEQQRILDVHLQRAISAEVEVLRTRLQMSQAKIERSQKEAEYRRQQMNLVIRKHQEENKPVPSHFQQSVDFIQSLSQKYEESLSTLTAEYESQIEEVKAGRLLSDLPSVQVSTPDVKPLPLMGPSPVGAAPRPSQGFPTRPQQFVSAGATSTTNSGLGNGLQTQNTSLPSNHLVPSQPVPPRPLTQISFGSGLAPLRPLTVPRPTPMGAAGPNRPPLRPLGFRGPSPMSSFEKLVWKLQQTFPNRSKSDFTQLIQDLRTKRGGSLSGMTIENIISEISDMINHAAIRTNSPLSQIDPIPKPLNAPPGLSNSWAFAASSSGQQMRVADFFQEEEDPCVICHEEMTDKPSVTLECSHTFHDECIRKWFQEQNTCPNCRRHALHDDDFPTLG